MNLDDTSALLGGGSYRKEADFESVDLLLSVRALSVTKLIAGGHNLDVGLRRFSRLNGDSWELHIFLLQLTVLILVIFYLNIPEGLARPGSVKVVNSNPNHLV